MYRACLSIRVCVVFFSFLSKGTMWDLTVLATYHCLFYFEISRFTVFVQTKRVLRKDQSHNLQSTQDTERKRTEKLNRKIS